MFSLRGTQNKPGMVTCKKRDCFANENFCPLLQDVLKQLSRGSLSPVEVPMQEQFLAHGCEHPNHRGLSSWYNIGTTTS